MSENRDISLNILSYLFSRSDVLKTAMSGNFREKEEKRIEIKTFSDEAVELFVKFLYGYELEEDDINENYIDNNIALAHRKTIEMKLAMDLIEMGGFYNVPNIQSAAATLLLKHITPENMVEIMDFVKTHNPEIARICSKNIAKNFSMETLNPVLDKHPEIAVQMVREISAAQARPIQVSGIVEGRRVNWTDNIF